MFGKRPKPIGALGANRRIRRHRAVIKIVVIYRRQHVVQGVVADDGVPYCGRFIIGTMDSRSESL